MLLFIVDVITLYVYLDKGCRAVISIANDGFGW